MSDAGTGQQDRVQQLLEELKALRKGYGVNEPKLADTVGPLLRRVCGVLDTEEQWDARERIRKVLDELTKSISEPERTIVRVGLGFDSAAGLRYTDRLKPLEQLLERDMRTVQRRSDNAFFVLAERATAELRPGRPGPPWHTAVLRSTVVVSETGFEVTENRRIISHRDNLSEIDHSVSVLPRPGTTDGPLDLSAVGIDAVSGGRVTSPTLSGRTRAEFTVCPPEPLGLGAEHEFEFRIAVPDASPFYFCTPNYPCDSFVLHVRFDRGHLPTAVYVVNGDFSVEAADPTVPRETISPDASGEVRHTFDYLEPYRSYGLLWAPAAD